MDMRLDRDHKGVSWIDVSGWGGLTGIIWCIAGDLGQNAAPRSRRRPQLEGMSAPKSSSRIAMRATVAHSQSRYQ